MRKFAVALVALSALATSGPAAAATLAAVGNTGELLTPGEVSFTFDAGAGAGNASFLLRGYRSLDGGAGSCCSDVFSLLLNGVAVFSGAYAFGGTGINETFLQPTGTTIDLVQTGYTFTGGYGNFSVPLTLLNGSNTITFSYAGALQTPGDEAWGVDSATITGNVLTSAVPEPAAWAMMLGGLALTGAALRRRRPALRTTVRFA